MKHYIEYRFQADAMEGTTVSESANKGQTIGWFGFSNQDQSPSKVSDIDFRYLGKLALEDYKCSVEDEIIAHCVIRTPESYTKFFGIDSSEISGSNLLVLHLSSGMIKILHVGVRTESNEIMSELIYDFKTTNTVRLNINHCLDWYHT